MAVIIRHAERVDRQNTSWSALAKRPQDTPLSERGKKQAARLGKWLYGRLPVNRPTAIFCSPFARCVQTADAIAAELEGLQREGLHAASATQICVEPGLAEDLTFDGYKTRAEKESSEEGYAPTVSRGVKLAAMGQADARDWPWMLHAADLVAVSPRVNLSYKPLRGVSNEDAEGWVARFKSIVFEIANHPLVREGGTAIVVTHGCPSTHMVKSLCPKPGGLCLPDYKDIKVGNYDGPPLQYTATTALQRDPSTGLWDLAPSFSLFSNEHDPRLKEMREAKTHKVTRYVIAEGHEEASGASLMQDFQCSVLDLEHACAGSRVAAMHPTTGQAFTFTVPHDFKSGDRVRVRHLAYAASDDDEAWLQARMELAH